MPPKTKQLPIEDIPLPPEDPDFGDDDDQTNTSQGKIEGEMGGDAADKPLEAAPPPDEPKTLPIKELDFVDDEGEPVLFKHPFRLDGELVKGVFCRPLTLGQVQALSRQANTEEGLEVIEIYALIAGIDVSVLLGLKEVDGDAVVEVARDFLPLAFRGG